jgi:hypothetical protein
MQRRTSLAMLALASSVALVAGCGSSSSGGSTGATTTTGGTGSNNSTQSPSAELTSAFSALGKASTLTSSFKLGATADNIKTLAGSQGATITDSQAAAIAGAQISVEVQAPSGKTLSDLSSGGGTGAAVDFTVSDNGTNFLTLRSLNKTLYLQVDLKDLLSTIGESSALSTVQGLEANPQFPAFVKALIDGKWVSLPTSAATGLAGGATGGSSANPQQEAAVVNGLKQILANDVTVTRTSTGSTDVLKLTANSKTVATDFISTITAAVPSAALALGSTDPSQIPSKDITLGATVTGGALTQLSIDIGQFAPANKPLTLPIQLNFSQSGSAITAPSGAVPVDTAQLSQLFGSFAGGLTGAGG